MNTANNEYVGKAYSVTTEIYHDNGYGKKPRRETMTQVVIAYDVERVIATIREENASNRGILGLAIRKPVIQNIIAIGYITDVHMISPEIKGTIFRSEQFKQNKEAVVTPVGHALGKMPEANDTGRIA